MNTLLTLLSLIFITPYQNSDYKIFVTNDKYQADLWVYRTDNKYQAKNVEQIWFQTYDKYASDFSARFVDSKYKADLIIYYTKTKNEAGWKKQHRLRGSLIK